ncbi:unnamed protein product [Phytophthora lilii]|uniref:Unnamed protein product n=1 Tax=Phytophthora lilii TaxID=2077276 RepID=A0A9W6U0L7_9STRA|nr:unnamed protein product [Phytophthora lilii]
MCTNSSADMPVVELKDLGVVSEFLGISFTYDDVAGWELDQAQVIQDMLEKFQLDKAASARVPIGGKHYGDDGGELLPVGGAVETLQEIGLTPSLPSLLHVDNQAAIVQIQGKDTSGRAKRIDVRYKFIKDMVKKQALTVEYCESKAMRADIPTKVIPAPRLNDLRELVMLKDSD